MSLGKGENLVIGAASTAPLAPSPFRSRWVELPAGVTKLPDDTLAAGFLAAGVAAGIKPEGRDIGLLVSTSPGTTSAARFTISAAPAAPVELCRKHCDLTALKAVVVNSGNANAGTGGRGFDLATYMQGSAAMVTRVPERQVAVASTGVIGVQLSQEPLTKGISAAARELRRDGAADFSEAILTTDNAPKRAALAVELGGGRITLSAQAKGAGMIAPNHATLLCFVETDADLSADLCARSLALAVDASFDRTTVDGQLSTNDSVFLLASGASGFATAGTEDEERFSAALSALLRALAIAILHDGEGAERVGRVVVEGGAAGQAGTVARAVANSPLVKAALNGGDPNWGRILQAAGMALAGTEPAPSIAIAIEGIAVASGGAATRFDLADLAERVAGREVEIAITLGGGDDGGAGPVEMLFSDLSHGYVTINADYTT